VVARSTALGDLGRATPTPQKVGNRDYPSTTVEVVFGRTAQPAKIVHRDDLSVGSIVEGPAIVTESTATTVLPPGSTLTVDAFGTLVVAVGKEA